VYFALIVKKYRYSNASRVFVNVFLLIFSWSWAKYCDPVDPNRWNDDENIRFYNSPNYNRLV